MQNKKTFIAADNSTDAIKVLPFQFRADMQRYWHIGDDDAEHKIRMTILLQATPFYLFKAYHK